MRQMSTSKTLVMAFLVICVGVLIAHNVAMGVLSGVGLFLWLIFEINQKGSDPEPEKKSCGHGCGCAFNRENK